MADLKKVSETTCFGGLVQKWQYTSKTLGGTVTKFNAYIPQCDEDEMKENMPTLYYLSGLTCNEDNFFQKAGPFRAAAANKIILIGPDTSPRGGEKIEEAEKDWDFGTGAGFYVNATEAPYSKEYNMYEFVTKELPKLVEDSNEFPTNGKKSVTGHSMGGHGALICHLKNPGMFKSCSAFSPICNPVKCQWGEKNFGNYLGQDKSKWVEYDATELVAKFKDANPSEILIDQGLEDNFLKNQLYPENFKEACTKAKMPLKLRYQKGYDHGYYFISTFIEDHINHAAKYLNA